MTLHNLKMKTSFLPFFAIFNTITRTMSKSLAVFDFDYTITDDSADMTLVPLLNSRNITASPSNWLGYMNEVLDVLGDDDGIDQEYLSTINENIPPVEGMLEVISHLQTNNFDMIIMSDTNSFFIDVWLKKYKLEGLFLKIYTNPGKFVNGKLRVSPFHQQSECKLCPENLCKGKVLDNFLEEKEQEGVNYDRIIYLGDGSNDFCPILRLRNNDLGCVRENFKCVESVRKARKGEFLGKDGKAVEIKPKILIWNTGFDVLKEISNKLRGEL